MTFRFAGAAAQVCRYCRVVVARTDRDLRAVGRAADLIELPSPLAVGATGRWGGEPFVVAGRVLVDRAGAPGAPWQEMFIAFPSSGRWCWVAAAQGRWYATSEAPLPAGGLPPIGALRPGGRVLLHGHGEFAVIEVGRRRVVSAEGELPHVAAVGVATGFADIGAPGGVFGTLDYGDGRTVPEKLYLGRQIDPAVMQLDAGAPAEPAAARVAAVVCPSCGGNLPLAAPGTAERIVCRYCGTASDLTKGALVALGQAPKPPVDPYLPLGAEGQLRGMQVICVGFVIRGCTVDGERYRWREYLLYAGPRAGYLWLMEEDGAYRLATPVDPGEVQIGADVVRYQGRVYALKQSVQAAVEYVVGEFYWKVEVGESVRATEYAGPGGEVSVEEAPTEVTTSFCTPVSARELGDAFHIAPPHAPAIGGGARASSTFGTVLLVVFILLLVTAIALSDCNGDVGGPGILGGPSFGGK